MPHVPLSDVTVAILEPPLGPFLPPTPGMEPGTPVLSLDWMTSPSRQEPGRSWPTKDTVAVGPEAHLPSWLMPARDNKGVSCPQAGEHIRQGRWHRWASPGHRLANKMYIWGKEGTGPKQRFGSSASRPEWTLEK